MTKILRHECINCGKGLPKHNGNLLKTLKRSGWKKIDIEDSDNPGIYLLCPVCASIKLV